MLSIVQFRFSIMILVKINASIQTPTKMAVLSIQIILYYPDLLVRKLITLISAQILCLYGKPEICLLHFLALFLTDDGSFSASPSSPFMLPEIVFRLEYLLHARFVGKTPQKEVNELLLPNA